VGLCKWVFKYSICIRGEFLYSNCINVYIFYYFRRSY